MNLILIKCVFGGSVGMLGKSLLNEKAIIILSLINLNVVTFCDLHHPGLVSV